MNRSGHVKSGQTAFKVLNFFLRSKKPSQVVPERRHFEQDEIKKIFRRCLIRLRTIYILNQVTKEIVTYGTSSNLYDISTRDRPALQKYLFPLSKSQDQDDDQLEFPIIHPNSIFRQIWNGIFLLMMIYVATILPFRISFYLDNEVQAWYYADIVTDVLFWFDLIISFLSGYYDEEGKLVKKRKIIFMNYLKGWFTVDLISCLPLNYVLDGVQAENGNMKSQNIKLFKLLKLPRMYRLFKIIRFIDMMKYLGISEIMEFFQFNYGFSRLLSLLISVCLVIHLSGCLWFYVAAFNDFDSYTWVSRNDLTSSTTQTKYIASIYYAFTTLTTVGYGDIHSFSSAEMIITIFLMIVGVGFYSMIVGLLSSILSQIDYKGHKLQQQQAILNEFCIEKKISLNLREKLKETLQYSFDKNCFTWADNKYIFKDLPINLRYDIIMNIHNGVFGNMQLFQLVDDKQFLVKVVPLLKPILFLESEIIWEQNSNPDAIYFIAEGRMNFKADFIVIKQTNQKKQFAFKSMIGGSYFGEIEIFLHTKRETVAQCESQCEMYYLTITSFENEIYDDFPHIMTKMKKIALERRQKNLETIQQLQQFIDDATKKQLKRTQPRKNTVLLREYIKQNSQKTLEDMKPNDYQQETENPQISTNRLKLQDLFLITQEIEQLLE
ncbi:unnamed protein product [Paramecium octaurelia]|uniref:Cyclic nucleotide-binding domain-containing protein n=1 Tax=Paramecium octaurelia TaxID=43137 RepID=A0A8S1VPK4_PAROT|nr:unnamed protein product [Paramecium octaurelia]